MIPAGSSSLSVGAIVGIVVGSVAVVALGCFLWYHCYRRNYAAVLKPSEPKTHEPDIPVMDASKDESELCKQRAQMRRNHFKPSFSDLVVQYEAPKPFALAFDEIPPDDGIIVTATAVTAAPRFMKQTAADASPSKSHPKPKLTAAPNSHWAFSIFQEAPATAAASPSASAVEIIDNTHSAFRKQALSHAAKSAQRSPSGKRGDNLSPRLHLNDVRVELEQELTGHLWLDLNPEILSHDAASRNKLNCSSLSPAAAAATGRVARALGARGGGARPFVRKQALRPATIGTASEVVGAQGDESGLEVEPKWLGDSAL